MKAPKILVLSASVGGGHVAAAEALVQAAPGLGLDVQHVDILKRLPRPLQILFRDAYFELVANLPDFVSWVGNLTDANPSEAKPRLGYGAARVSRLLLRQIPALIREVQPDLVLHTHFIAPAVLSRKRPVVPEAVVVTDYGAHNFWLQRGVGRYFVATDETAAHLMQSGVEQARVRVSGIPISEHFGHLPDKAAARAELGLGADRDVLLLNVSGFSRDVLVRLLESLKTFRYPLTAVVICGRSVKFLELARSLTAEHGGLVTFRLEGFTRDMPGYMAAADLLVGKPGGLTVSEALAAGLPFGVVDPYPVQEEANQRFLLENGAALAVQPLTVFDYKLRRFFEDKARREAMTHAARQIARPQAAHDILRSLLEEPLTK